jgi:ATP-dependent helicase/nuclease subunit B
MGIQPGASLDAWLREGGVVIASSDRAARAIQADFHRRRRAEGLSAWPAPIILDWKTFALNSWEERNNEGRLLLNRAQELSTWSDIVHSEQHLPTALPSSARRLAEMAMEAHDLVCSYAPHLLRDTARVGWDRDAEAFSGWLADFNRECQKSRFLSSSRVPLELITTLRAESVTRPPILLAGFDRILPIQRELFDAWGAWQIAEPEDALADPHFYSVRDSQTELESCAYWCYQQLASSPGIRLLVVTQDQARRRGEIERAFLRFNPPGQPPAFEFSLGIPLSEIPFARSGLLLLRWLQGALDETELDWLFAITFAATPEESSALQSCMRLLRRKDLQRVRWTLESFLNQAPISSALPRDWARRIIDAQRSLKAAPYTLNPIEWAEKVPHLLATTGWRGSLPQTSVDYQAQRRWTKALDTAGSLGFDARRVTWSGFLAEVQHAAEDILFAPQSVDAPIQIAGPAESAGLTADAIWFLGADEDSWPAVASTHPFLPVHIQREFGMPHSSHQEDWEFSAIITRRLCASAPSIHFTFAIQKEDVESSASRIIERFAGESQPIPSHLIPPPYGEPIAVSTEDFSTRAFAATHLHGGSAVLSSQSQCPFKAFATARLSAETWDTAESGLTAKQRGQILHDVLRAIWSGHRPGIRTHHELLAIKDLTSFVCTHVEAAMKSGVPAHVREQMPAMYLNLEETRVTRLITEWLNFEKTRIPFNVEATEARSTVTIAGLTLNLRLDRVDRLHDGSHLVVDYKTGNPDPKAWDLPRPEDVQLPLYKVFGLEPLQPSLFDIHGGPASGGLVFARVRSGDTCFAGRVADARATINSDLSGNTSLVKRKLTAAEESEWRDYIEKLAQDFIHGRTEVDPRDYPDTCKRCGLQPICRIQESENRARFEQQDSEANGAAEE